jgi:ABC-type transport system substrate-binding protein
MPKAGPLTVTNVKLYLPKIRAKGETHEVLAQRIVEDLAKAGITVELVQVDQLYQLVSRGEFEGLALLGRDTTSAQRFMNVVAPNGRPDLSKPAGAHYDAEMVERWERFDTSLYAERRGALEASLQKAWFARLPMLPLVLTSRLAAVRVEVQGPDWGQADSLWWNVTEWHRERSPSGGTPD